MIHLLLILMKLQPSIYLLLCFALILSTGCEVKEEAAAEIEEEPKEQMVEAPLVIPEGANPEQWEEDIAAFEAQDVQSPPPEGAIVFVGSSSIRLWDTLHEDMAPMPVIQRGFGGSRLFDAIYYTDRIITPYDPKMLVVFSGTNDIAGDNPKSAEEVTALYKQFVQRVHHRMADLPIYFIAISPTKSRWEHKDIVFETNERVKAMSDADERLFFIDTATALLDENGEPDDDLFVLDRLHLNADGYAVWTSIIKPVLMEAWTAEMASAK